MTSGTGAACSALCRSGGDGSLDAEIPARMMIMMKMAMLCN